MRRKIQLCFGTPGSFGISSISFFCFRRGASAGGRGGVQVKYLVAGEGAGCGRRVVLLAGVIVEHADDHKCVGASEASAALRLLDISIDGSKQKHTKKAK